MGANMHDYIIHIIQDHEWVSTVVHGSGYFDADGEDFFHFSFVHQIEESANLHFEGKDKVRLLVCESERFGDKLKIEWVKSRKEQMPHVYMPHFDAGYVKFHTAMRRGDDGKFYIPPALDAFLDDPESPEAKPWT